MLRFDSVEHRAVERIKRLVATSARAGVENRVFGIAVKVRVTRIYFPEIGQQRNQMSAALINSVADFVYLTDLIPGVNFARTEIFRAVEF